MSSHHYIINKDTGARLCRDGCWREFAYFGTSKSCVKVYRTSGWAIRGAERIGNSMVLSLASRMVMDASGEIFESVNGQNKSRGNCLDMKPKVI